MAYSESLYPRHHYGWSDLKSLRNGTVQYIAAPRPELYDLQADPWEIHNLASDPAYADTLIELRERLDRWMEETNDHGRQPEAEAMYNSDMAAYLHGMPEDSPRRRNIEANIRLMKQWAAEGK